MISKRESSQHPFYAIITGAVKAIAAEGAEAASVSRHCADVVVSKNIPIRI